GGGGVPGPPPPRGRGRGGSGPRVARRLRAGGGDGRAPAALSRARRSRASRPRPRRAARREHGWRRRRRAGRGIRAPARPRPRGRPARAGGGPRRAGSRPRDPGCLAPPRYRRSCPRHHRRSRPGPAVAAPPLPFPWRASPDERVVLRRDGPTATVLVTEDARGARRLRINGQYALGGGDGLFLERREGLLPVLLHPAPRRLLHLGVGTGDTLRAAMTSPGLTADGVELVSSALDAAAFFSNQNGDVLHEPGVHLVADDARSFLLSSRERWDVIVVDLVLPWTQGAGALFSRDFYRLGLEHLAAGGVLCQWLPLHQLQVGGLEAIVSTFTAVFPHVQLWVAYHRSLTPLAALIGSASPITVDADALRARLRDPVFLAMARGVGLNDPDDLGMLYVTDGDRLRTVVRDVPWITDDRPRIEFSAPRGYFHQEGLGGEALVWVAARLDPAPAPIAAAP